MKYLNDYIIWAREQMAKFNPPKQQPTASVQVVEEKIIKKPRKKKETTNVTN